MKKGLLLPVVLLSFSPFANSASISVNFGSNEPNGSINTSSALTAGAIPIPGTKWNNAANATGSLTSLLDSTGGTSGASVTWTSANTWRSASGGATATSLNGNLTKGYLDDSSNSHLVTFSNVPYLKYTVYFIGATDSSSYSSPTINGTRYSYTGTPGSGSTIAGTANWGNSPYSTADTLVEGGIYLKIQNQTSPTLTVKGGPNNGSGVRGSFGGVQIEDTYAGTLSYWDIDGATAGAGGAAPSGNWTDANWSSSSAGTAATGSWTSGNAAVIAAGTGATGTYSINLGGTQTADYLWVQEGNVTFTGGQLDLTGSATLRADGTGSITMTAPVGGTNISTVGSVIFNATNVNTGTTSVLTGSLRLQGGNAIPDSSGVSVNSGASLLLDASESVGPLQGGGNVAVDTFTLTVNNTGTASYGGSFTGTGSVVFSGTGTVQLTAGSASYNGSIVATSGVTLQPSAVANVFGTTTGTTTIQSGASLLLNGYDNSAITTPENIRISGPGVGGAGAITCTSGGPVLRRFSLDADAAVGGPVRWQVGNGTAGQRATGIDGNNKILTKVGANNVWFRGELNGGSFATPLAGLVIDAGVFGIETSDNALGTIPVTVNTGGTFSAWTATPSNTQNNPLVLNGGTLDVDAGGISFGGAVTLTANSAINSDGGNMTVGGAISESGGSHGFTKTAGNTLTLSGANTYTGTTTVNGGTLAVSGGSALPDNSPLVLNGGGLALNASETVGSLSGTAASPVSLGANTLTVNQASNGAILAAVSGTGGSIVKSGPGLLALNADNTYTGTTSVNAGTLQLGGLNASTAVTVAASAGLRVGPVAGPAATARTVKSLALGNNSVLTFRIGTQYDSLTVVDTNGLSTGTATTINIEAASGIAPGTYTLIDYDGAIGGGGYNFTLGSMPHIVASLNDNAIDGKVELVISAIDTLYWTGTDGISPGIWDTNTTANWILQSTLATSPFYTSDNVVFNDSSAVGNVTVSGSVSPGSITFDNATTTYVLGGNPISGSGTVTKNNSGTATLIAENTFTGLAKVNAGVLAIGNGVSGSLAASALAQADGGELQFNPVAGGTVSNQILVNAGGTCRITGTGNLTMNTALTAASTGAFIYDRAGTVYCNVANQSAGSLTIASGTVAFDGNQINDRLANNKVITVNAGGTMAVLGVNCLPGGATNSVDPVINGGTLNIVTGGSPAVGSGGQSHCHIRNLTLTGGTVTFSYSGGGSAYNGESFQLNGNLTVNGSTPSVIQYGTGGDASNSGLALYATRTIDVADVTSSTSADLIVNAEIEDNDAGGGGLIKSGAGTMVLNASNTYTGSTTINAGVLEVGASGYLYNAGYTNTPVITVNTGATLRLIRFDYGTAGGTGQLADYGGRRVINGGTVEVTGTSHSSGNDFTVAALGGAFHYMTSGETLTLAGNSNTDIQLDGNLAFQTTGNIAVSEVIAGTGALGKSGNATLTLSAANTYSGGTTVNAGTLRVTNTTGSATGTGAVSVADGAALAGNGIVSGSVAVAADGRLSPGSSAGTLSIGGNLDVSAQAAGTGKLYFELDALASTSDKIAVTGNLIIGTDVLGFSSFAFTNLGGLEAGTYKLITSAGITGSLDPADLTGAIGSFNGTLQITGSDLELVVSSASTPFQTWIAGYPGVGGLNGLADDADGDGAPNFLEFALNSNPADGTSGGRSYVKMGTVGGTPDVLTLTIAVRNTASFAADGNNQKAMVAADSLTYTVEAANILSDWGTPLVSEVTGTDATTIQAGLPVPDSGWTYHTFRTDGDSLTDPVEFIRAKVTTP